MSKESQTYKNFAKKVYIRTYGCQMNQADSERMTGLLAREGYALADDVESADVVLLNTCSIRKHAEDKVWSELGRLGIIKQEKGELVLGVCGCMAQREGKGVLRRAPFVDVVCGPHNFGRIVELIDRVRMTGEVVVEVGENEEVFPSGEVIVPDGNDRVKAWVSIMRGCNNFCAYCVVPYLRGRERSRPVENIVAEIKSLVAESGVKEVTLLGQNVNSYKYNSDSFVELLKRVNEVERLARVRFVTSHPRDMSEEILKVVADSEKICEHLHLPFQSGSNRILKLMNRGYDRDFYRDIVRKARMLMPEVAISTDIIVGFPGERDEDFEDTFDLVKEVEFSGAFIYKYSTRPGTAAEKMKGKVAEKVKKSRLSRLQELQDGVMLKNNQNLVGREVEVLVDGLSKKDDTKLSGRTQTNKIVVFEGNESLMGKLVRVRIEEAGPWTMFGRIV